MMLSSWRLLYQVLNIKTQTVIVHAVWATRVKFGSLPKEKHVG